MGPPFQDLGYRRTGILAKKNKAIEDKNKTKADRYNDRFRKEISHRFPQYLFIPL